MRSQPGTTAARRFRAGTAIAVTTVLALTATAGPASAEPSAALDALPSLMNLPGLDSLTGGGSAPAAGDGRTNISLPLVPQGGVRKQFANAPAVEQSTGPQCAPFVFVGVPGTFEINRDDKPTDPVGMLKKITDPLAKQLGNQFVPTMINYDADAGVNGTSYRVSSDRGVKKALATVTDVAKRCQSTSIIIGGYSQGAAIAGTVATAIGQKRTPVDPARIGGVVLVADPMRNTNSNVIADTNQNRPDLPDFLANVVGQLSSDPSFAQLQMTATNGVDSLLSGGGLNALTSLAGAAGEAASTVAGAAGAAGQSSGSVSQSSPETAPQFNTSDPSVTSESTPTDQNGPGLAGSNYAPGTAHFQPVDEEAGPDLPVAKDELKPVTSAEVNAAPAGVAYIGNKQGQWLLIADLSRSDLAQKAKGGWYYGRTAEEKAARTKVVDDLFLNSWDKCADLTLAQCRASYVTGLPDGKPSPNILIPSSSLTTDRDALVNTKNNDYVRPDESMITKCADKTPSRCALIIEKSVPKAQGNSTYKSKFPTNDQEVADVFAKATGFKGEDGKPRPLSEITEYVTSAIEGANPESCSLTNQNVERKMGDNVPDVNKQLMMAWYQAHRELRKSRNSGKIAIDTTKPHAEIANQIRAGTDDEKFRKCLGWATSVWKTFDGYYGSDKIIYATGYNPGNDWNNIVELYRHGGCGTGASPKNNVAPNGDWTLRACQSELSSTKNNDLTAMITNASAAYSKSKPDWRADVLVSGVESSPVAKDVFMATSLAGGKKAALGCDTLPARTCAIARTLITGPSQAPAGITKAVKPVYPTRDAGPNMPIIWNADPSPVVEVKDGALPAGHVWATAEALSAVKALDEVRATATSATTAAKQPKGVTTIIEKSTGKEIDASDDVKAKLGAGWVWSRNENDNKARPAMVSELYTHAGCNEMTYSDCLSAYTTKGHPEYALTNAELTELVNQAKDNIKQKRVEGYDPEDLPGDVSGLKKHCATLSVFKCASRNAPETAPSAANPSSEENAGPETGTGADGDSADDGTDPVAETVDNTTGSSSGDTGSTTVIEENGGSDGTGPSSGVSGSDEAEGDAGVAGGEPADSTVSAAGGDPFESPTTSGSDANDDGGLANSLTDLIEGDVVTAVNASGNNNSGAASGGKVDVSPITQKAVAGGGLEGRRDADFGALKGRVVSLCVPGDVTCSLPEDSQLATDLVKFAQNLSLNFPDMASDEGATRMGGLLAFQGLNTVAAITGMPETKLSADTLQALINIAAGGAMLAAEQPAGASLVADGVAKLPDAMPEIFAQLADVPELLRRLPDVPQKAADNTGIGPILARVTEAFQGAGMTSPLDVEKYPDAASAVMKGLVEDNTGLVSMATNPQYWRQNAHVFYPQLNISGGTDAISWAFQWFANLAKAAQR